MEKSKGERSVETKFEFITRGEEVFLLTGDTQTISLPQAIGMLAMSTYENMMNLKEATTREEEKGLEKKILFQSKVLNALSNACEATRHIR